MINIKYLAMHKVKLHACAISTLLYGFASVQAIIFSLKLGEFRPVHTHNHAITYTYIQRMKSKIQFICCWLFFIVFSGLITNRQTKAETNKMSTKNHIQKSVI